jgi:hypothetical protein
MDRINLTDVTFTIPVRIDSNDRLRNLRIIINDYINKHFNTNIIIGEDSIKPTLRHEFPDCGYIHFPGKAESTHRTKTLNNLARAVTTPIIINIDADVLVEPKNVLTAIKSIRGGKWDCVYPYSGKSINVPFAAFSKIVNSINYKIISAPGLEVMTENSSGGIVAWRKSTFMNCGMENENIISSGYEDSERLRRVSCLGLNVMRIKGPTYHLDHWREGEEGVSKGDDLEYDKVASMNPNQLNEYIKSWDWAHIRKSDK